jgi:hypothetical protein
LDSAGGIGGLDDEKASAVEGFSLVDLVGFGAGQVAVIDGEDFTGALELEIQLMMSAGNKNALVVGNLNFDMAQITLVGFDVRAIRYQDDLFWFASRAVGQTICGTSRCPELRILPISHRRFLYETARRYSSRAAG